MKNLSFLISLLAITVLLSCGNNKNKIKSGQQSVVEIPLNDLTESGIDTNRSTHQKMMSGEIEIQKDTLNKDAKYSNKKNKEMKEAPKHNSSHQSKVDSLKKVKRKLKK